MKVLAVHCATFFVFLLLFMLKFIVQESSLIEKNDRIFTESNKNRIFLKARKFCDLLLQPTPTSPINNLLPPAH